MPQGGILVINNPHSMFWKAWAGTRRLPVVEANGIHMAVGVPANISSIKVRYERPLLRDLIASRLFGAG